QQRLFIDHGHAETFGLVELRTGFGAGDDVVGLARYAGGHLRPQRYQSVAGLGAGHAVERARQYERFVREPRVGLDALHLRPGDAGVADERVDDLAIVPLGEELDDVVRHHRTDVLDFLQFILVRAHDGVEIAEVGGQLAGGGLADLRDAERVEETGQRGAARLFDARKEVLG